MVSSYTVRPLSYEKTVRRSTAFCTYGFDASTGLPTTTVARWIISMPPNDFWTGAPVSFFSMASMSQ